MLVEYVKHHTLEESQSDPLIYFGLVKHVEIICEAVYKLTLQYRANHNEVNWDEIFLYLEAVLILLMRFIGHRNEVFFRWY